MFSVFTSVCKFLLDDVRDPEILREKKKEGKGAQVF
jgi:hypothetical protein